MASGHQGQPSYCDDHSQKSKTFGFWYFKSCFSSIVHNGAIDLDSCKKESISNPCFTQECSTVCVHSLPQSTIGFCCLKHSGVHSKENNLKTFSEKDIRCE